MYEITVQAQFNAMHALKLPDGTIEPLHGHDWRVWVTVGDSGLDESGFVADFEDVSRSLETVLSSLRYTQLDDHPWFAGFSPSTERVARVICDRLRETTKWAEKLLMVEVEEAPGCRARYRPQPDTGCRTGHVVDDKMGET